MTHPDRRYRSKRKITKQREKTLRDQIVGPLPRLRRFGLSLTKDLDTADDLVQGACERALTRLDQLREGSRLDSWLYRIAVNRSISFIRQKKRRKETVLEANENIIQSLPGNSILKYQLEEAIKVLPPKKKSVFLLHDVQGFTHSEIARIMEWSEGTSKSQLFKARMMIRKFLKQKEKVT